MRALAELWRIFDLSQRRRLVCLQLLAIPISLATVASVGAIGPFFAVLGDESVVSRSAWLRVLHQGLGSPTHAIFATELGVFFLLLVAVANTLTLVSTHATSRIVLSIGNELQISLYREYLRRDYSFHVRTDGTTLFNNVVYEADRISSGTLQNTFSLVTSVTTAVLVIASIAMLDPVAAMTVGGSLTLIYVAVVLTIQRALHRVGMEQVRSAHLQAQAVNESLRAVKDVIATGSQSFFVERFAQSTRQFSRAMIAAQTLAHSPRYIIEILAAFGLVVFALLLNRKTDSAGSLMGQLSFLGFAAYRLLPNLQQAYSAAAALRIDLAALGTILPDLRLANRNKSSAEAELTSAAARRVTVELRDVHFRYPERSDVVLNNITVRLSPGQLIGIRGLSGSGKTTLLDIVAALLKPTRGEVLVNGRVLREDEFVSWRGQLAYVVQNACVVDGSIAENIALGVASCEIDPVRLRTAAEHAQLGEFIASLPNGFAESVGEAGIKLSGGQRQRLAIARALYRNASLVLLDEPTSALDAQTEARWIKTLEHLRQRATVLLVSHREAVLDRCDTVYELREGNLVEEHPRALKTGIR